MANHKRKAEIINPPNALRAKLAGGGYLDSDIIARGEKAMAGLSQEFADWLIKDLATLSEATKHFSEDRNPATAGALFRAAHDLRGQATTFEYPFIARIAASLAKLMQRLSTAEAALETVPLPLVTAHLDAIQVIHREKIKDISNLTALTLAEELEGRVMKTLARAGL